jgi:hypothetical protein
MAKNKNIRVELEMKISRYRSQAREAPDAETARRELEQKQREIDE